MWFVVNEYMETSATKSDIYFLFLSIFFLNCLKDAKIICRNTTLVYKIFNKINQIGRAYEVFRYEGQVSNYLGTFLNQVLGRTKHKSTKNTIY